MKLAILSSIAAYCLLSGTTQLLILAAASAAAAKYSTEYILNLNSKKINKKQSRKMLKVNKSIGNLCSVIGFANPIFAGIIVGRNLAKYNVMRGDK